MAVSQSESAELCCPTCSHPFTAQVWLVVDRQERPDLVGQILDGTLNVAACPGCGAAGGVNHPLLLHDKHSEQVVVALPLTVHGPEAARELVGDLLQRLLDGLPSELHRPYLGEIELVPELDGLRALLIEQAMAADSAVQDQLLALAVQDLLNVGNELDFQRVIAEHRSVLLTERAEHVLEDMFREARRNGDQELRRRVQEARAVLGRLRTILINRRSGLASLLDELVPLEEVELAVLPQLKRMLDALDPQEVYTARIGLAPDEQATIDRLIDRMVQRASQQHRTELLTFLRNLAALPQQ